MRPRRFARRPPQLQCSCSPPSKRIGLPVVQISCLQLEITLRPAAKYGRQAREVLVQRCAASHSWRGERLWGPRSRPSAEERATARTSRRLETPSPRMKERSTLISAALQLIPERFAKPQAQLQHRPNASPCSACRFESSPGVKRTAPGASTGACRTPKGKVTMTQVALTLSG